jgi:hypothetical protein
MGFLFYVKYKESNKTDFLLASKRLIQKSIDPDNSCVKLRVMPIVCLGGKERNVSQIVIDCLDSSLIKINVVARNFTQELSGSIDF